MPPSGRDLLQYMTERAVRYLELPKADRKQHKAARKQREAWQYRWFGMVPVSMKVWKKRRHKNK